MSYEKEELPPVHLRFGKDALKHTTDKAWLFNVEIGNESTNVWLPKSQVISFEHQGDTIAVVMKAWLVQKNKLDMYVDETWIAAGCP